MAQAIKFYFDEHIANAIAHALRKRGVDVVTVQEMRRVGATDRTHLELATAQGRVVMSKDSDYLRLHANGIEHAGIAFAPSGRTNQQIIERAILICELMTPEEMKNHVEYL